MARSGETEERGAEGALNSAINPCRSSFETAAKKRKALGEKNCGMFTGVSGVLPDEAIPQTRG